MQSIIRYFQISFNFQYYGFIFWLQCHVLSILTNSIGFELIVCFNLIHLLQKLFLPFNLWLILLMRIVFCGQHSFVIVFYSAFNDRTLFGGNLENGDFQAKLKSRKMLYLTIITRYDTNKNIVPQLMSFNGWSNSKTPKIEFYGS